MCTPSLAAPNRPCTTPAAALGTADVLRVADFDHAYAAEAMARALACAGDLDQAYLVLGHAAGAIVADDEDRQIFTDDLATGPWFGLELTLSRCRPDARCCRARRDGSGWEIAR